MTTNYYDTFIEVAEDCPVTSAEVPAARGDSRTVAVMQFEKIAENPYRFTSDEIVFDIYADRAGIPAEQRDAERERYFSKGQPCLRSSPLGKRYGWGTHHDAEGRVAVVPLGSVEYAAFRDSSEVAHTRAMRSKRAS